MANGSLPVLHYKDYAVGPLWFLMCYFVSAIFFFFLLRMKSEVWRIVVLGGGFLLAMGWRHYFNLLPFDILNAIPSIGFMYLGYKINNPSVCEVLFRNKVSLVIGYSIAILCCLCGEVSMASMIYRFLFLQFIGALYCCFIIYKICPDTQLSFGAKCFSFIGRNSLALVCIHSVDYLTGITESIMRGLMKNGEFTLMLETVLKILFVVAGYIVIRQIPLLRSIYGISVSLKKAFNK
mgnify:FL=1